VKGKFAKRRESKIAVLNQEYTERHQSPPQSGIQKKMAHLYGSWGKHVPTVQRLAQSSYDHLALAQESQWPHNAVLALQ